MQNFKTDICTHCGADTGLHQFETMNCPKNGSEETREGFKQIWMQTVFEDSGEKRLRDSAPKLYEALQTIASVLQDWNKVEMGKYKNLIVHASTALAAATTGE